MVSDKRTWRDVYSTRNYDYLAIVVGGETPVWSKEKEKFVSKEKQNAEVNQNEIDDLDSELTMGNDVNTTNTRNTTVENTTTTEAPSVATAVVESNTTSSYDSGEDDDLPF